MTAEQRQAFERARARVARLEPDVITAILAAIRAIGQVLVERELVRLIASGAFDRILAELLSERALEQATLPVRLALRDVVEKSFRWNVPYLPNAGKVGGSVAVRFDVLNPRVSEALRSLETPVITDLHQSVRDSVRQRIARGLESQESSASIARGVREIVGLPPRLEEAVANFRGMLERGDREALSRILRDRRFDQTLEKALGADGKGLTPAQVDRMVDAYRRKALASHAETISRTSTIDAYKVAQRASWQSAIDRGIVDPGSLMRQWIGVDDDRERDSHRAMNDTIVRFDQPYPNGQQYPGEGEYNCRCIDRFFVA